MRPFLYLLFLLFLAASAAGCGSKAPAGPNPPPGVIENPVRPNPDAIKQRKLMLIEPHKSGAPSRFEGKR